MRNHPGTIIEGEGDRFSVRLGPLRLIFVPALLTLGVTLLRLTGELRHWSGKWFSTQTGGPVPQGVSWVIGITWLAVPFGIYFALKLARAGEGPRSLRRALACAALGLLVFLSSAYVLRLLPLRFPGILIFLWLFWALAAALQFIGWPSLAKVLLWYGLAARIPVAIVMFFAMLGNWGTHYDYVGIQWPAWFSPGFVGRYLWLAFFPQLVAWVSYTIALGSLCGTLATTLRRQNKERRSAGFTKPGPQPVR
jgi:hypothetical protein